jgi:hypothetical protein
MTTLGDFALGTPSPRRADARLITKVIDEVEFTGSVIMRWSTADTLYLESLRAITRGGGKTTLDAVIEVADRNQVNLALFAQPYDANRCTVRMTKKKLIAWYERFGFEHRTNGFMVRRPLTK